jgi:hypothetical protein
MANADTTYTALSPLRMGAQALHVLPKARIETRAGIGVEAELYGPKGFVAGGPVEFLKCLIKPAWRVR